jgi:subtilisin family serine protease
MKKIVCLILGLFLGLTVSASALELDSSKKLAAAEAPKVELKTEFVPGELLIKFRSATEKASVDRLNAEMGLTLKKTLTGIGASLVTLPAGMDVQAAMDQFRDDPRIEYVEPNYYMTPTVTPNDAFFGQQWWLNNTGQTVKNRAGLAGADMGVMKAWLITQGIRDVIIAVVDTGVDIGHPDIRPNLWVNTGELAGHASLDTWQANGLDDDGNGYKDDIIGWDFHFNTNSPIDFRDGHGTHVAGIAAAKGNNVIGVAGVSWKSRIMPLAVQEYASGGLPISAVANAIIYAELNGAHVINLSLGSTFNSITIRNAINFVRRAVIVCAAGNSGADNDIFPHYPSSYPKANLISVAATNSSDQRASFSNYGRFSVDVAAPGVDILSTFTRHINPSGYQFLSGTSMATPMVSGLAALLLSFDHTLSAREVASIIIRTADVQPTLAGRVLSGGRINAWRALQAVDTDDNDDSGCFIKSIKSIQQSGTNR